MASGARGQPNSFHLRRGHPLARGLVLCVTFERKGVFWDAVMSRGPSSAGRDASNWIAGTPGPGVVWSGAGQGVVFRHIEAMEKAAGTIEVWVRPGSGTKIIACKGTVNAAPMAFIESGVFKYRNFAGLDAVGATAFTADKWYHVVFRDNGVDTSVWLDGELDGTGATFGGTFSDTDPWYMGTDALDVIPWNGAIAMFRVWNRGLSDAEIKYQFAHPWGLHDRAPRTIGKAAAAGGSLVKTVNGLAQASVKTVNGLAIASVKTINGLANV